MKGNDTWIVLEGLYVLMIKQFLNFEFKVINNQVEYEALITEMILTLEYLEGAITYRIS